MHYSSPSLHPVVIVSPDHKTSIEKEIASLVGERSPKGLVTVPSPDSFEIPLTTVSLNSFFDAYIDVWFKGTPTTSAVQLLLDSGNSMLVVPRWEDIEAH